MALLNGILPGIATPGFNRNAFGSLRQSKTCSSSSGGTILVIDACHVHNSGANSGNGSANRDLRACVEELGKTGELVHEVVEAQTTTEALTIISTQQIDVVLVDLLAPELGGPEFCRILKRNAHTQFLPVFIVADSDDEDSEVQAINAGADEFLVRPLRPLAVSARIQASIRHRAMIESLDDSEAAFFSLAQFGAADYSPPS